jgi:hypothetical protein
MDKVIITKIISQTNQILTRVIQSSLEKQLSHNKINLMIIAKYWKNKNKNIIKD